MHGEEPPGTLTTSISRVRASPDVLCQRVSFRVARSSAADSYPDERALP